MNRTKKEIESWRLERFKSFIADFPNGRIEDTEEPDFLIHQPDRIFGIELTDLHRKTLPGQIPQQASEAMRSRVVARAQEIYESRNQPPVIATLHLDDRVHIKKSDVERLATDLADLVSQNIPTQNSTAEVPAGWEDMRQLPEILHKLSVHRLDAITKTFFSAPGATWIRAIGREDIQRALDSKESKYPAYRARCDEAWLVINADLESMSTWFEFDMAALEPPFLTKFNRLFLVQHFGGKAHELRISSCGAASV